MNALDNKFDLGFFPTPLQPLGNFSHKYPEYNKFIKRDNNTGLASGGNRTRKLEYFIRQAINDGCTVVLTAGAQQSNHCRQTAAACAVAGLKCHLMLGGKKPDRYNGNLLLSSLLGFEIHFTGDNRKGEDLLSLKKTLEESGEKCLVIPYGGSNGLGTLGFVNAVNELKTQLAERSLVVDYIFFASSSGATQAGLVLGRAMFGLNFKLIPIRVDKSGTHKSSMEGRILEMVKEGANLMGIT